MIIDMNWWGMGLLVWLEINLEVPVHVHNQLVSACLFKYPEVFAETLVKLTAWGEAVLQGIWMQDF